MKNLKQWQMNLQSSDFRIVELDGVFTIQRQFKITTESGFLWWAKKKEEYVWKNITKNGCECYRMPLYGTGVIIDTYKDKMQDFTSLEDAKNALHKLINPAKTVYHYL